jgi:hypothetical protein
MTATIQTPLFLAPVDIQFLDDEARTVLEAIDRRGPLTAREAGEIVYRLRGYRTLIFLPKPWLTSTGGRTLRGLERSHLVRRTVGNRWRRSA